jgi:hypothetical protein
MPATDSLTQVKKGKGASKGKSQSKGKGKSSSKKVEKKVHAIEELETIQDDVVLDEDEENEEPSPSDSCPLETLDFHENVATRADRFLFVDEELSTQVLGVSKWLYDFGQYLIRTKMVMN